MTAVVRYLLPRALRKGFLGGSRFWTVLGVLAIGVRVLKRVTRSEPEVVYSAELAPGQSILLSHDREARVVKAER